MLALEAFLEAETVTVAPKAEIRDFGNKSAFLRKSPYLRASGTPTGASNRQRRMPKV